MLLRLVILFTVLPLVELWLLIRVGQHIGAGPTVLLVVGTGVVGAALARREGLRVLGRIQAELNAGRLPADRMIDALLVLVAGILLVTPGILTDIVGFILLIAPLRRPVRSFLKKQFRAGLHVTHFDTMHVSFPNDLIDTEARPIHDDDDNRASDRDA